MNVILFSHLRYDSVTQRPHHIAHELAHKHGFSVLFVEEPIFDAKRSHIHIHYKEDDLAILTPHIPQTDWRIACRYYSKHLRHYMNFNDNSLFWFYSPHFAGVLDELEPDMVVYDVMDELSNFKFADPKLPEYEATLLSEADIIFTGGTSLYYSKRRFHPQVYNFPSSVDTAHFMSAREESTRLPNDIKDVPTPIAGYYGVLDERLDLELMAEAAESAPDISWVYIGPVVKIDEAELPKRDNIYYLGPKAYKDLPRYLSRFTVAIMPFALNKATQFISPTKTLEFMAGHKPIVSTPIKDVMRHYKHIVRFALSGERFADQAKELIAESASQRKQRIAQQNIVLRKTSWSHTVAQMLAIIKSGKQKNTSSDVNSRYAST
jgi:glycosyltransferase involved in cell wall biosynthesis